MADIRHVFTNAQADATGTLTVWGGTTTATVAATDVVRPTNWNSGHAFTLLENVSFDGNTAGVMANISSGAMVLAGGNNITLSQNGNSVTISGGAGGAGDGINALAVNAGGTSATTTFTLSNSNNVSFGLNAGVITASATFNQSVHPAPAISASNSLYTSGTVVLTGGNNITVTYNGATVSISGPNTHAQQTGVSGIAGSAASTVTAGTVQFANLNNVSFGLNGSTMTASVPAGVTATGNLSGVAGSAASSVTNGIVQFSNMNGVSFGLNGSTMTASHNALTSQSNQAVSNSLGSFTFQTLNFSDANNVTWGTSAGGIVTASVAAPGAAAENNWFNLTGNTVGNTSASGSTIMLSAGNNVTLSGTNGSVIRIDAGGGGAANTVSKYYDGFFAASATVNNPAVLYMHPFTLYSAVSASTLIPAIMSFSGTITSAATAQAGVSLKAAIYSQNATNATRFDTLWTEGISMTFWNSGTSSYSYAISDSAAQTTGSSAGSNLGTANVMGNRIFSMYPNQIFNTGAYIFAVNMSTSTAGYSAAMSRRALYLDNPVGVAMGTIGGATTSSIGYQLGQYSVSSAAFPNSIGYSELLCNANVVPFFCMGAI